MLKREKAALAGIRAALIAILLEKRRDAFAAAL